MDLNDLRDAVTLLSFLLFLGLMAWAYWPSRKGAYDAAAELPFRGEIDNPRAALSASSQP